MKQIPKGHGVTLYKKPAQGMMLVKLPGGKYVWMTPADLSAYKKSLKGKS